MSENMNGTTVTIDADRAAKFAAFEAAEVKRIQRLADAKEARERNNTRPFLPDGTNRMNATQAYNDALASLVSNWLDTYADDPSSLARRMRETLLPAIRNVGNQPSTTMASSQDAARGMFVAWEVPAKVAPTAKPTAK